MRSATDERAVGALPRRHQSLPAPLPATLVAFYLPQFHRIAENDAWWGEGFTEWRNVTRALPQFEGHFQPRLPGALGFYDLSDASTLHRQADLAREYGIGAFCFYYYWFNGRRLLESPLEQWLADKSLQLSVCLCWANEPWTRQWDGRPQDTLIAQRHDDADDMAFISHVSRYLEDERYLRIDGRPLILIYRPGLLPNARATTERWRAWCRENGIGEIFIAYVQSFERPDPADVGCDAAIEFPPNLVPLPSLAREQHALNPAFEGEVLDWRELAGHSQSRPLPDYLLFPGVNPGWDNQPRRPGAGRALLHASPRRYQDWLEATIRERSARLPQSHRLVFVNAWNEWAEGAILEPDARWDHAWLDATRAALRNATGMGAAAPSEKVCAIIHAWYPDVLAELLDSLDGVCKWRLLVTTGAAQQAEIHRILQASGHEYDIITCANRGRDILPFLVAAARLRDEGVPLVLKLHTKRSTHRPDGAAWRKHLVDGVLPRGEAKAIVERFMEDTRLGLLAPMGHLHSLQDHLGANENVLDYARRRVGIPMEAMRDAPFVAGSMFWVRTDALAPILDAGFMPGEFEDESGQLDGTLAHALERLFGVSAKATGYEVEAIPGDSSGHAGNFYGH
ncbi:glycoside hydrolase family 99-like domain-containing protein [Luteimonas vadosa]|uniref:glycoside hydrolase family 99-like domain-containing protein n=1 Tax=Luteimonas vadosa TaxID=1165507 RepID=UPI0031EE406B